MGTVSYIDFPPYFELQETPESFVVTMRLRKALPFTLDAMALAKDKLGLAGAGLDWSCVAIAARPIERDYEYVLTIPTIPTTRRLPAAGDPLHRGAE